MERESVGGRQRLGRAALYYAKKLNWAVFPLRAGDKTPLIPRAKGGRGCLDGTTDAAQIVSWWRRWPNANIGLVLGARSGGLLALDVDPRNGGDRWNLLDEFGPFPETVEALTGGGGFHILFRGSVRCGELVAGVDVKGEGGYIVLPPSVHPSGQDYRWEASSRPDVVAVADPPGRLLKALGAPRARTQREPVRGVAPTAFALGAAFQTTDSLGPQLKPGVWAVRCPNRAQHTTGRDFDSSTVLFAPRRPGGRGLFHCKHSHCAHLR
jgi:hypothetical protein